MQVVQLEPVCTSSGELTTHPAQLGVQRVQLGSLKSTTGTFTRWKWTKDCFPPGKPFVTHSLAHTEDWGTLSPT